MGRLEGLTSESEHIMTRSRLIPLLALRAGVLSGALVAGWLLGGNALADGPSKKLTSEERKRLEAEWEELMQTGVKQYREGKYTESQKSFEAALAVSRRLYPKDEYPEGHEILATSLNNVAVLLQAQGKLAEAERISRDALIMSKRVFKGDHAGVAMSLNTLALALAAQGKLADAEPLYRDALAMTRRLFRGDHPYVATGLNNLAKLLQAQGKLAEAEKLHRQGLAMTRRLFRGDHADVATGLNNLGWLLQAEGKLAEAESLLRDALAMRQRLFKGDHPDVAGSLNDLALLLHAQGKAADAEPLSREALAMYKRVFKGDHSNVAISQNTLALLLEDEGKVAEAQALQRDALAMSKRLFKGDHPYVAMSLNNIAVLLQEQGELAEAKSLSRDCLAMYRRLLTAYAREKNEGDALNLLAAQPLTRDAFLSVAQRLQSEPASVYAEVWASKGAIARVFEHRQQAARAAVSNPQAAKLLAELAQARRERAWLVLAPQTKDPATGKKRDEDINALENKIAQLERDVRSLLPSIARAEKLAAAGPADLQKALPADVALVDFLRYTFLEFDPRKPGTAGEKRTASYVAFVVTKDRIRRVELGSAEPLEEAVATWRELVLEPAPRARAGAIPVRVRELVWAKVRQELPPSIQTVYIGPDLALCRLPWAALPGDRPGTILLEDFALAVVPHAPFLLDQLWPPDPLPRPPNGLLVVGGAKYDADVKPPGAGVPALAGLSRDSNLGRGEPLLRSGVTAGWPFLNGTLAEARGVAALAAPTKTGRTDAAPPMVTLEGNEATTANVLAHLPRARYAHLATHGFFADPSFRSIFQIDPKEFDRSLRGERVGRAATSPLVMTGLVLAGANHAKTPGRGIITGEALVDLDLSGLELVVLSACETGLGDVAGGEGTFSLQRAFHLAGARNVIASLWKVNDDATAALMVLFYHKLWKENKPALVALREAQLTLYHHPERIPALARERGLKLDEVVALPPGADKDPKAPSSGKAPVKLWAAFVLSGPGR
jgi:CHAT domain-containing protein